MSISNSDKLSLVFSRNNSRIHFGSLIFEAAKQGDWEGLELILSQDGAADHIEHKDKAGRTPLVVAASKGNLRCVKILLASGCDLHVTVNDRHGKEKHVWEIAASKGHRKTAEYLNGCLDDLTKFHCHRAMMEADVLDICQNKAVTRSDLADFDKYLNILKTCSTFDINGDEISNSLLIIATKADNEIIVKKLLEVYKATPYANDLKTGESALHIACKLLSPLRFYLTRTCRDLIFSIDLSGEQPLHVSCKMNDVTFVTWLFQRVLEKMEQTVTISSPVFNSLSPANIKAATSSNKLLMSHHSQPALSNEPLTASVNDSLLTHRQLPIEEQEEDKCCFDNSTSSSSERVLTSTSEEETPPTATPIFPAIKLPAIFNSKKLLKKQNAFQPESTIVTEKTASSETTPTHQSHDHTFNTSTSGYQTSDTSTEEKPHPQTSPAHKPHLPPLPPINYNDNIEISQAFIDSTSEILYETTSCHGPSPFTLDTLLSVHMRLFAISANGNSILHIIAREGYDDLLNLVIQVAKYLEHNPDGADVTVLTRKESSKTTPLEEAIDRNQCESLSLLLEFSQTMPPIYDTIYNDTSLLARAVESRHVECLKVLIKFGLWRGIEDAIKIVIQQKLSINYLNRIILFYYTQIKAATLCSRVKRNNHMTIDSGVLCWNKLNLTELDPIWLQDAHIAIATVSHSLRVKTVFDPLQNDKELFVNLGKGCVEYFDGYMWQPQAHPTAWASLPLTDINLSANNLEFIPLELLQIQTMTSLNLSQNCLTALPSNFDPHSPIYSCSQLTKLDLSHNSLVTLPVDIFYSLGNSLEELYAHNNIIDSLPPSLWICTRLHTVNLSHNCLSQLHYFSDLKYFYDKEYSRNLINCMQIEQGVPVNVGKIDEEEFMNIMNYATRLNVFYHTVRHLLPSLLEETTSVHVLQQLVDIHWLRTKLNSNQPSSVEYYEMCLPPDEVLSLTQLDLSFNKFTEFPRDLPCLAPRLEKLDIRGNSIKRLWLTKDIPSEVASLILSNNDIHDLVTRYPAHTCMNPVKLLDGYILDPKSSHFCRHKSHCILDKLTNLILQDNKIVTFPCISREEEDEVGSSQSSFEKVQRRSFFPMLSVLSLERNNLQSFPEGIHYLTQLSSLSLSHNSNINYIPPTLGLLNPQVLLILKLDGITPKNVDLKLLSKHGTRPLLTYLKSLYHKSQPYLRIKLMFIGDSNVGKTSLLLNLTKKGKVSRFKEVEKGLKKQPLSTVGVDLGDWEYSPSPLRPKVTFMTWDFGGQIEYYATHQCFLTQRSLYIIVWNAEMRERGLESIRSWLDNIGGRIPKAPVIVVATHLDGLASIRRGEEVKRLQAIFHKNFISSSSSETTEIYQKKCIFVSCSDGTQIAQLRDDIYEFALSIKPVRVGVRNKATEGESLLRQPVPASYMKLQDIVRNAAKRFIHDKTPPILNTKEFRKLASDGNFPGKLDELEQGTSFLHENGIMLHFDDPALNDLYFIDPQWLCSMLACVVTVQEKNPFQKNGFMEYSALQLVLRDDRFPVSFLKDFVSLMQKFEVVLLLNENRLLIPSLLPDNEDNSCVVFPLSVTLNRDSLISDLNLITFARISSLEMMTYTRYYLLPFVPNGFFPRLIARVISSKISSCFSKCVPPTQTSFNSIYNEVHWRCWRSGISLIHRHMEILRIAPVTLPVTDNNDVLVTSSYGEMPLDKTLSQGLEILVAILPHDIVTGKCEEISSDNSSDLSHRLAVWLLRQLTDITDSVFDDWYEGFTRRKSFDVRTILQASPCPQCVSSLLNVSPIKRSGGFRKTVSTISGSNTGRFEKKGGGVKLHLFTSPYCVVASAEEGFVSCVNHGVVPVSRLAPDLAFADFPSSMLFHKPKWTITRCDDPLGSGGFGKVYKGNIEGKETPVAIKEFSSIAGKLEENPSISKEINSWDIYINVSREARMMHQLQHDNILGLLGLAFQPLRLVLELAPLGDLKNALKPFKREKVKLNRRSLKQVIRQVTDALSYIHSKHIIYRDLKPGNVLVWSFPEPKTQWNTNITVSTKLADYGISRHCTPEGAKGSEGTPAYLPPEVILHGGTAAFSTQLDVYSFAMFLYYLFTYLGPFENEKGRPISALLDEGKRPELPVNYRPVAIQMYELMCWCWSDNPEHRPTFNQIKDIIDTTGTFTQLLDSRRLTQEGERFTASCMHSIRQPYMRRRQQEDTEKPSIASPSPSILSVLAASSDDEDLMSIFYGTSNGKLGIIQFLPGENTVYEVFDILSCQVTSIVPVGASLWVSTWGKGVIVYSVISRKKLAIWGEEEGITIYKLLHIKEASLMVALCATHVAVIETSFNVDDKHVTLVPKYTHTFTNTLTTGTVIMPHGVIEETEVWACPMRGGAFKVLSNFRSRMFSVRDVSIPCSDLVSESSIHYMESYEREEETKLVVADGRFLQFWDVCKREKERADLDCHTFCKHVTGKETDNSNITCLRIANDRLFVGTCGGIIVVMDTIAMEIIHLFQGYQNEVSSILTMAPSSSQLKRFSRILSKKDSLNLVEKPYFPELTSLSSGDTSHVERNIVLSLGCGYRSIVGGASNHPNSFIFPSSSSNSSCTCCGYVTCTCGLDTLRSRLPCPSPNEGHLLFWSCENSLSSFSISTLKRFKKTRHSTIRRVPSTGYCNTILEQSTDSNSTQSISTSTSSR